MFKFARNYGIQTVLAAGLFIGSLSAQVSIPQRVPANAIGEAPYTSVGLLETQTGQFYFRGSGTVARDSRIIFSCAHVVFDRGRWADYLRIAVGWSGQGDAPASRYTQLRGYRVFSSYASNVSQFGDSSDRAFNTDFMVGFGTSPLGPVVDAHMQGAPYLTNSAISKFIVGYPALRDFDGVAGFYYMHYTGPFSRAFTQYFDAYHGVDGVSTGEGNSGGPVFEISSGSSVLAAILVSGTTRSAGVYAIDPPAWDVASNAISAISGLPVSPPPVTPGTPDTSFSSLRMDELLALREVLVARMARIRKLKNPQARVIQQRRVISLLTQVNREIAAAS